MFIAHRILEPQHSGRSATLIVPRSLRYRQTNMALLTECEAFVVPQSINIATLAR